MSALIRSLAVSGSRNSDGTVNDSGKVFLYEPNTTTIVAGYQDDELSEAWPTTDGGIPLDEAGKVEIWLNDPVDIVVEDSEGTVVSTMLGFNKTRAEQVEVENDFYTGAFTDPTTGAVSQALGGRIDLDTILTRAGESLGPNFQYQGSAGETPRNYIEVIGELQTSVVSFDADPTGNADSTTAIQTAANRAKALGAGLVYFPPGTYKVSAPIALSSATGVSFVGAGSSASKIIVTNTTTNIFTLTSCTGFEIKGLQLGATATNSASAISLATCTTASLRDLLVDTTTGGTFLIPVAASGTARLVVVDSRFTAKTADATARALKLTDCNGVYARGGFFDGIAGAAMEFAGTTSNVSVIAAGIGRVAANIGMLWTAGMTGTFFTVAGCNMQTGIGTLTTAFDMSALTTDPLLRQWGNDVDGYVNIVATGTIQTPDRSRGEEITYQVTSGGAGTVTIANPTPVPASTMRNVTLTLKLVNALGGAAAVTWAMSAGVWKLAGGVAPLGTDGTTTVVRFVRDVDGAMWREVCRANSTT